MREEAVNDIAKIQEENKKSFNKNRKEARKYEVEDIVAIRRTQGGLGLKFHTKYLGPYKINKVLRNNRFIVEKIGEHEGPNKTNTSTDYMKPWANIVDSAIEFEDNDEDE